MKSVQLALLVLLTACGSTDTVNDAVLPSDPVDTADTQSMVDDVTVADLVEVAPTNDTNQPDLLADAFVPGTIPPLVAGNATDITSPAGIAIQPSVALDADGSALVVFTGAATEGGSLSIFAQRDDGATFALHAADSQLRNEPSVCALNDGSFVAVWSVDTAGTGTPSLQIGYTIIHDDGPSPERRITTEREGNHWLGHVACSPDGGFIVAGVRPETDDPSFEAFAMRFDKEGEPLGQAMTLNTFPEATEAQPVAGASADGVWAAWSDLEGGSYLRRAFDESEPFLIAASDSSGMAMGTDPRVEGGVLALNVAGPTLEVRWLTSEGTASAPIPLIADGANSRHTAALTLLERPNQAAIIYLTSEGANSRAIVSTLGTDSPESLTVATGKLPPYTPSIAFRGGALVAAWTEPGEDVQFKVRLQRW
jgi:hypothetical protein